MYPPMYQGGMPNYSFNPYQQYPQYQQQIPQYQQRQSITGRVVSNPEEITPQEVPTDGSVAFFPASDNSCIYGKRWMPDGSISTVRFIPDSTDTQKQPDAMTILNGKLDQITQMLEDMKAPKRRTRKAVDDAEL